MIKNKKLVGVFVGVVACLIGGFLFFRFNKLGAEPILGYLVSSDGIYFNIDDADCIVNFKVEVERGVFNPSLVTVELFTERKPPKYHMEEGDRDYGSVCDKFERPHNVYFASWRKIDIEFKQDLEIRVLNVVKTSPVDRFSISLFGQLGQWVHEKLCILSP